MPETQLEIVEVLEGEIVNTPLTDEERQEHDSRVARIHEAHRDIILRSIDIWKDLQWIQENKTYREQYDSFQDFCKAELGKDNSIIYRYIKDGQFKETLLLEASTDEERASILNLKEGNTRFLRGLPEETHVPFWKVVYGLSGSFAKTETSVIEPTTSFLESVAGRMDEILEQGGLHIDGEFVSVDSVIASAQIDGVDEDTAKAILLRAGVSEDSYEALQRQAQHIRERSVKADVIPLKGTIEARTDVNGSTYPALIDSKGNEYDLADLILAFSNRFVQLTLKAPIRELD